MNMPQESGVKPCACFRKDRDAEWMSPSDIMIGKVELKPPFTSRYIRGEVHQGILKIGNDLMKTEDDIFATEIKAILAENDEIWSKIIDEEKEVVKEKVTKTQEKIFSGQCKIMASSFQDFYEKSLQELEVHMRSEHENILKTTYAEEMSRMNIKIREDLQMERAKMEEEYNNIYNAKIKELREYYYILMKREKIRSSELINKATADRDESLEILYKEMEIQNITGSMYVICSERKKCHVKNYLLQRYCDYVEDEELKKLLEKCRHIKSLEERSIRPDILKKQWQDKIGKILQMFLRFISYCLKLLPEQTTFLLNFEKMVILQLNKIIRSPGSTHSIVLHESERDNDIQFFDDVDDESKAEIDDRNVVNRVDKKPFVIYGDFAKPEEIQYGSRETLPLNVDLPFFILDNKYFYAKCGRSQDIKSALLCECKKIRATCGCDENSSSSSLSYLQSMLAEEMSILEETSTLAEETSILAEETSIPMQLMQPVSSVIDYSQFTQDEEKPTAEPPAMNLSSDHPEREIKTNESDSTVDHLVLGGNLSKIDYCPRKKCGHWLKLVPSTDKTKDFDFNEVVFKKLINELALEAIPSHVQQKFDNTSSTFDNSWVSEDNAPNKSVEIQCSIGPIGEPEDCPCCDFEAKMSKYL